MPPFPKPRFQYDYDPAAEIRALREYFADDPRRAIPKKHADHVLLATWNIANLGLQQRRDEDHRVLAEIISWFDIVAVQEVRTNLAGLRGIAEHLPASYRWLYSDTGGNDERLAFVYDGDKLTLSDEIGEVAPTPNDYKTIKLPGVTTLFNGFDRTPYLATFALGDFMFSLVTAHLFYGSESAEDIERRSLEAAAVAWWTDRRHRNKYAPTKDVLALGDLNLPKLDPSDPIFQALTRKGLRPPDHSTLIGSNLNSDMHYDQIMFFPGSTAANFTGEGGVVDFDGAVFRDLWDDGGVAKFQSYIRYYLSDHRPYWAEFKV